MKKVFIIHCFEGSSNGGWRPWLMAELEKQDIYACSLSMPSPEKPILQEWLDEIKRYVDRDSQDEIYLVGHSLGGTAILRYLEKYTNQNIKGVIFVSTPCEKTKNEKIYSFLDTPFNYDVIKSKVSKVAVIHGSDDPYVPVSNAAHIAKELNGKLILVQNGKHLNGSAGFTQLPECLDSLLEIIK